ncbi:hypothetical protein MKX01_008529 [Papaver californicum]|nr:hypothetical protein MKX01_008529 [Papaver californicum]
MELSILFIATLILTVLSNMLTPCFSFCDTSSTQHRNHLQPLTKRDVSSNIKKHIFTKLPRKFFVNNNAGNKPTTVMLEDTKKIQGTSSDKKTLSIMPCKRPRNHDIMEGRKGTHQTWVESKAYQYFTMDYTEVRRRRRTQQIHAAPTLKRM